MAKKKNEQRPPADARDDLGWPELRVLHVGVLTTADSRGYQPGRGCTSRESSLPVAFKRYGCNPCT
jgi:hypothetical protein